MDGVRGADGKVGESGILTKARAKFMIQLVAVARPAALARTGRGLNIGVRAERIRAASGTYKISEM